MRQLTRIVTNSTKLYFVLKISKLVKLKNELNATTKSSNLLKLIDFCEFVWKLNIESYFDRKISIFIEKKKVFSFLNETLYDNLEKRQRCVKKDFIVDYSKTLLKKETSTFFNNYFQKKKKKI